MFINLYWCFKNINKLTNRYFISNAELEKEVVRFYRMIFQLYVFNYERILV